jgi:hypothetical protein
MLVRNEDQVEDDLLKSSAGNRTARVRRTDPHRCPVSGVRGVAGRPLVSRSLERVTPLRKPRPALWCRPNRHGLDLRTLTKPADLLRGERAVVDERLIRASAFGCRP